MTASPRLVVDIVADPVCPWCHVGLRAFAAARAALAQDFQVIARLRAYALNPDTPADGVDRARYLAERFPDADFLAAARARLGEAAAAAGFAFDPGRPSVLPNPFPAQIAIRAAHFEGRQERVAAAIYDAYWMEGRDIGRREVLLEASVSAGMDETAVARALDDPAERRAVEGEAAAMRRAGVTGVPTFIIGERTGFSGALPPDALAAAIRRAAASAAPIP